MTETQANQLEHDHNPTPEYNPGHPWYYLDGWEPIAVDAIEPARCDYSRDCKVKDREAAIVEATRDLENDIERYLSIVEKGADALSNYDVQYAANGDPELAVATALALKHNHIAYSKGLLIALETGRVNQMLLF